MHGHRHVNNHPGFRSLLPTPALPVQFASVRDLEQIAGYNAATLEQGFKTVIADPDLATWGPLQSLRKAADADPVTPTPLQRELDARLTSRAQRRSRELMALPDGHEGAADLGEAPASKAHASCAPMNRVKSDRDLATRSDPSLAQDHPQGRAAAGKQPRTPPPDGGGVKGSRCASK